MARTNFVPTVTARLEAGTIPSLGGDIHGWTVNFYWEGGPIDRPHTFGIWTGHNKALGNRLVAAANAGVVFETPTVKRDTDGKTYVQATCRVSGRHINADLRRLGY